MLMLECKEDISIVMLRKREYKVDERLRVKVRARRRVRVNEVHLRFDSSIITYW
jgi:hypothetical protein